jgi:hypothetical protein
VDESTQTYSARHTLQLAALYASHLDSIDPEINAWQDWHELRAQDEVIQIISHAIPNGHLPADCPEEALKLWRRRRDLVVLDGKLWYSKNGRKLFVVPAKLRQVLIAYAHGGRAAAHEGVHTVKTRLQNTYWWPAMKDTIAQVLSCCDTCQRMKSSTSNMKA